MKRVNYFELDLPRCANTYGVSPCTAALSGDSKCFNSRVTCQDVPNFRLGSPVVASLDDGTQAANSTTHNVNMPADVGVGDLLLVLFCNDGSTTVTTPAGWSLLDSIVDGTAYRGSIFGKVALGSEDGTTVNFQTSSGETGAWHVYQVLKNNWFGRFSDGIATEFGTSGTTDSPDPPLLEPGWGIAPTLWIAGVFGSSADGIDPNGEPDGFGNAYNVQGGTTTTGASTASGYLVATAESLDPAPFSMSSTATLVGFTIAVRGFEYTTLRFATPAEYNPKTIEALPSIESIVHTPAIIGLGDNIGERASLQVNFRDEPHSDTGPGYDKYLVDRSYDPFTRGTHWGKFRARHPYLQGAPCRLIRGEFDGRDRQHGHAALYRRGRLGPGPRRQVRDKRQGHFEDARRRSGTGAGGKHRRAS